MKISVIIPCFNEEKYLDSCFTSLVEQSLSADEVILCDNNSTDHSIGVARKYQKKLPLKIINQPIQGIMPTVEKAWQASSGDIILKIDADTVLPKDWTKNIVNHFKIDPNLAACGGNWVPYKENAFWRTVVYVGFTAGDIFLPIFRGYKFLFGPNMAIRRKIMVQIEGYKTNNQNIVDDQLISEKLTLSKLKYQRFPDCWNYHSGRQFHKGTKHLIIYALSAFFPSIYPLKTT